MKREEKLFKNTVILTIGTAFSSVFAFLFVPVFSRWLTTSEYGTYDLYLTYVTLLIPLVTLSCGEAAFRFLLDRKDDEGRKIVINCTWSVAFLGTLLGVLIIIFTFSLLKLDCTVPFVILFVFFILYNQGNFVARGFRKLGAYTFSNVLYLLSMATFVVWLVFFKKMGLEGMLYGNAIGHFIGFLYIFFSCRMWRFVRISLPKWNDIKECIAYSAPLIPNSISWWIVNVSDRSIINFVLGAASNGIYAIAYKLPTLCSTVFSVFHMSWLESAVDTLNDKDRNEYTNKVFNNIFPFCFSIASGVLAINRFFYSWIWDSKYAEGYVYVWILLAGMCFSFMAQFLGGLLIAEKRTKANGLTTLVAAVINIIVHIALIKFIGLYAAAVSTTVSYISLFVMRILIIRDRYKLCVSLKSVCSVIVFGIVAVFQFWNNEIVGYMLFVFSTMCIFWLNEKLVSTIVKKLFGRKK